MKFYLKNILSLLVCILLISIFSGCGRSYEEKQEKKEQAQKEATERKLSQEKELLSHLIGNYDVVHFPPEVFTDSIFTYELQQYFKNLQNRSIAFRGYIEDLEQINDNKIFVEFSCVISNEIVINPTAILFRLETSKKQANEFMNNKRPNAIERLMGYFRDPDYLIVAAIGNISKMKKYEVSGYSASDDEVEIEIETPIKFIGTGKLIEAVKLSKKDGN